MGAVHSQGINELRQPQSQQDLSSSNCLDQPHGFTRDWSDLPVDVINHVSTKLPMLQDVIHLRAICKSWHSAVPLGPFPRPPWIFMDDECIPKTLRFLSLDTFDYCIDIDETEGMQLVGTMYKHMVVLNEANNSMFLLNPVTGKLTSLPPFRQNYPRAHHIEVEAIQNEDLVVVRVKLSCKLVLLMCRPGDKEWRIVEVPYVEHGHTYYRGMYYISKGSTMVLDLESSEIISTIRPPVGMTADKRFSYLIEYSGELLGVWRNQLWCASTKEYCFEIYKLENGNQQQHWIKLNSISDRIMFLNRSTGFCFRADDFPGFKENSIYFISARFRRSAVGPREELFDLCKYDIKTGRSEELKSVESILGYWFFPSLV